MLTTEQASQHLVDERQQLATLVKRLSHASTIPGQEASVIIHARDGIDLLVNIIQFTTLANEAHRR